MKAVILAGGYGTRLAEETASRPKPMVEIGGKPILWHIMTSFAAYGVKDFLIAAGYKSEVIKQYFLNYHSLSGDLTVSLATGQRTYHFNDCPDWTVTVVDTGMDTQTGGRLKRLGSWIGQDTFLMTYGDGLANVDVLALLAYHRSHGKLATVTAVRPPSRFGGLHVNRGLVSLFDEKPQTGEGWINGGFFVLEPEALAYVRDDQTSWEREPVGNLVGDGQLMAYPHEGFWQPMDTLRDKQILEELWESGRAPWSMEALCATFGRAV